MKDIAKRLARNTIALSITQIVRVGFNTLLTLLVARKLGVEGLGKYAVLTAYLQIFQILTIMGVPRLVIREMARHSGERNVWFHRIVVNQLLGAVMSAFTLTIVVKVLKHPADTTQALEIIALSLFPFALSSAAESTFQAMERMDFIALAQIGAKGIQVLGSILALMAGKGIIALSWMIVISQSFAALIEISIVKWLGLWRDFKVNWGAAISLFSHSFDFFILSIFVIIFSKLDVLILSQMAGEKAVGLYNAAYLIIQVINFLSASYSNAAYPVLSRLFNEARSYFETMLRKSLLFGIVITTLIALLLEVAAEPIINLLYKDKGYIASALLLRIEAPFIIIFIWNAILASGLMVSNLQRRSVIVSGIKLGVGLIYYVFLTTWLGVVGTAIATVLAGFTGTVLNLYFINKEVCSLNLTALAVKPLAVGLILMGVFWLSRKIILPWLILEILLCYITLLIVLRIFTKEDFRLIWQTIWPL